MARLLRSPAAHLYLLAPLVAEFLLGDFPVALLPLLVPLSLWYGAGVLTIRELVRRRGLGWPSLLVLGLAFGLAEEGLLTMSLFNPHYADQDLLSPGHVAALGIGVPWTVKVLLLHVVWSVAVPISLVELAHPDVAREPWLGRRGTTVAAVAWVGGAVVTFVSNYPAWGHFVASPAQLGVTAALVALLVVVALHLPAQWPAVGSRTPAPALVLVLALLAGAAMSLTSYGSVGLSLLSQLGGAAALGGMLVLRGPGWSPRHALALCAGLLLTYGWHAFALLGPSVLGIVSGLAYLAIDVTVLALVRRAVMTQHPALG